MTQKIFLIGMPGSGKTYWGSVIAAMKAVPFIDLDEYIETREQKTIAEFFKQHDEKAFREIENAFLTEIIENTDESIVIACGGGTPCYKDNMSLMKQNGTVIYLEASISFIVERLKNNIDNRPLLAGHDDLVGRLQHILNEREAIYKQADHILQVDYITAATFDEILKHV
jgi:shikimate kinase